MEPLKIFEIEFSEQHSEKDPASWIVNVPGQKPRIFTHPEQLIDFVEAKITPHPPPEPSFDLEGMICPHCSDKNIIRSGYKITPKTKHQRFLCKSCKRTFKIKIGDYTCDGFVRVPEVETKRLVEEKTVSPIVNDVKKEKQDTRTNYLRLNILAQRKHKPIAEAPKAGVYCSKIHSIVKVCRLKDCNIFGTCAGGV